MREFPPQSGTFDVSRCRKSPPAPFPTGPLAIFSASLARALFVECGLVRRWNEVMRERNRAAAGCARGHPRLSSTMEGTSCDGALAGWLAGCGASVTSVTLASMTWTKSHFWLDPHAKPRTDGFVPPDASSIVVHGLRGAQGGLARSTWEAVHNVSSVQNTTTFPPLLWSYEANVRRFAQLHPEQHAWYWRTCGAYGCHRARGHGVPRYAT